MSQLERDIDLEESMEKCSAKISDRNYKTSDGNKDKKYENSDGKVYEKEKSDLLSEADIVVFKQEKGDELTLIVENKPVEMTNLELLEQQMIEEEFGEMRTIWNGQYWMILMLNS